MPMNPRLLRPLARGFNPRSISGLIGWWDASDASTLSQNSDGTTAVSAADDPVAYWKNKAGATNATQTTSTANRPLYKPASLNGKGTLFFDGSNDKLQVAYDLAQPFTVLSVHRINSASGNAGGAIGNLQDSGSFDGFIHSLFQTNTTQVSSIVRTGGAGTETARTTVGTDWYLLASSIDGQLSAKVNGGSALTAAVSYSARANQITFGASRSGESSANMRAHWTAELLLFNRILTASELAKAEGYLAWKYGLQGSLPTNHPYAYSFPGLGSQPQPSNAESVDWITAVYAAGSSVNTATANAVDQFVSGCKADGIWSAIKACCVLCGPNTLAGALVPLVGTAPTNNNFVSGDYNRLTGLKSDGSTKYLDSNRANDDDPQDDKHISVYRSVAATNSKGLIGSNGTTAGHSHVYTGFGDFIFRLNAATAGSQALATNTGAVFLGASRAAAASFSYRIGSSGYTESVTSQTPSSNNIRVFETAGITDARLSFYSIGESLDLSLLQSRVDSLIAAIGAS